MSKFETNKVDVRGDGKVILYQRADVTSSPKWNCRISVTGSTGYKRFSTKTSDQKNAERIALDKYFELRQKVESGGSIHSPTVKQVFEEWKQHSPIKLGNRKKENIESNTFTPVESSVVAYLGKKRIDDITNADIQDMMTWRFSSEQYEKQLHNKEQGYSRKSKTKKEMKYSVSTIRSYRGAINGFLKYCRNRGYITKEFSFEIPKGKSDPRPEFSLKDWKKLTTFMRKWIKEDSEFGKTKYFNPKKYRERFYLQNYILILGNTGLRVGEARGLRWIDLDNVILPDGEERLLLSVDGKTGKRQVIANAGTENYFKRLSEFRLQELNVSSDKFNKKEFIFCHTDGSSVGSYKKGFQKLLDECDLRLDNDGNYRTLYSLRHTYATMRINEVPIYQLAVNMGTSVKMIEEYYSHAQTKDPKFAESMTKGNQKGNSKVLPF